MPRTVVSIVLLPLVACAGPRPDPAWLYAGEAGWPDQPPVFAVRGLPGCRLVDTDTGEGVDTKAWLLAREALYPTVPHHRYSFFPTGSAFFLCESHDRLTGNIRSQDNLLHAPLSADESGR